jgi:hypothetical protein
LFLFPFLKYISVNGIRVNARHAQGFEREREREREREKSQGKILEQIEKNDVIYFLSFSFSFEKTTRFIKLEKGKGIPKLKWKACSSYNSMTKHCGIRATA